MKQNFSKLVSRIAYYGCWVFIVLVSLFYLEANSNPSPGNRLFGYFQTKNVDPVVQIDNRLFIPYIGPPREFHTMENPTSFFSGMRAAYSDVSYRPDFEQYPKETLLVMSFRLATYIGIVVLLFLLSTVLRSVYKGDPFNPANYSRLWYVGLIMIIVPIIRTLHSAVLGDYLMNSPRLEGWETSTSFLSLWLVLFGVLIIVLSYVFKELMRIHEEQQLTI